jgi:hypothetical protein
MAVGPKPKPLAERYAARVREDLESGCWIWRGPTIRGYGVLTIGSRTNGTRRNEYAHRVAWEIYRGPIPAGLFVLHRCDNPACSNPAHLFLGSHDDNMADRSRKGRAMRGSAHVAAKLTERDVLAVRASDETATALADRYGVTVGAISKITTGRTWRHCK